MEAVAIFADKDKALRYFVSLRWPDGVECPRCGCERVSFLKSRRIWKCMGCRKQFSAKVGTIFEDSALGLDKWLVAIWLVANAKNGISSCELHRAIGVTQKTAWFMCHRIRLAMETGSFRKLSGTVEADETFVGGKKDVRRHSNSGKGGPGEHKAPVFGVLERGGEARTYCVHNVNTVGNEVRKHVEPGSYVYTDKHMAYVALRDDYEHESVNHTNEFVRGPVHTNSLENFWCLFKRSIKGTWVRPSVKHLDRYCTDQTFRFNTRKLNDGQRFEALVEQAEGARIKYRELIQR